MRGEILVLTTVAMLAPAQSLAASGCIIDTEKAQRIADVVAASGGCPAFKPIDGSQMFFLLGYSKAIDMSKLDEPGCEEEFVSLVEKGTIAKEKDKNFCADTEKFVRQNEGTKNLKLLDK